MADSELVVASCCSDLCTAAVDTCFVAAAALLVGPLAFDCNSLAVVVAAAVDSSAVVRPFELASVALVAAAVVGLAVPPFAVAVVVFGSKLGIVRLDFVAGFAFEAAS